MNDALLARARALPGPWASKREVMGALIVELIAEVERLRTKLDECMAAQSDAWTQLERHLGPDWVPLDEHGKPTRPVRQKGVRNA